MTLLASLPNLIAVLSLAAPLVMTGCTFFRNANPSENGKHSGGTGLAVQPQAPTKSAEYESSDGDVFVRVSTRKEGARMMLEFQSAHASGRGAAPDGWGTGTTIEGEFRFSYEDSFGNKGSGTLKATGDGAHLDITLHEIADPRCMAFYGSRALQRR